MPRKKLQFIGSIVLSETTDSRDTPGAYKAIESLPMSYRDLCGKFAWAKVTESDPWWPAYIYDLKMVTRPLQREALQGPEPMFIVKYFDSKSYDFARRDQIKAPFDSYLNRYIFQDMSETLRASFLRAIAEARVQMELAQDYHNTKVQDELVPMVGLKRKANDHLGKTIIRTFQDKGEMAGAVISLDNRYYTVRYSNGDEEKMKEAELIRYLENSRKKSKKRDGKAAPTWQIGGDCDENRFGGLRPAVIEVESYSSDNNSRTFFKEMFSEGRRLILRQAFSASTTMPRPQIQFEQFGNTYSLLGIKVNDEGNRFMGGGFFGGRKKIVDYLYVAIEGPGLSTINLQTELEKIADFGAETSARKIASRMELFHSPAAGCVPPRSLSRGHFELIEENISDVTNDFMGDGCGFISCEMLGSIVHKPVDKTLAIQVRIFGPRLGIWKGTLCRKPGIVGIQLTPSMLKVGPSIVSYGDDDWVSLVVIRLFPSSPNTHMGKVLQGIQPPKSFAPKKLSDMVQKLWGALGVPTSLISQHMRQKYPQHTWAIGLADPTGFIPAGYVFATGFLQYANPLPNRIFVTRSPCVQPENGRMLALLTERPPSMSPEVWNWLLKLPFGSLMFSTCNWGVPLPMQCSHGDLDGDLYFFCWDFNILRCIRQRKLPDCPVKEVHVKNNANRYDRRNPNWLREVQKHMVSDEVVTDQAIIGKLYNEMSRCQDKSPLGMDDPDALHYAYAYLQAIDRGKHGIDIELPAHLRPAVGL